MQGQCVVVQTDHSGTEKWRGRSKLRRDSRGPESIAIMCPPHPVDGELSWKTNIEEKHCRRKTPKNKKYCEKEIDHWTIYLSGACMHPKP